MFTQPCANCSVYASGACECTAHSSHRPALCFGNTFLIFGGDAATGLSIVLCFRQSSKKWERQAVPRGVGSSGGRGGKRERVVLLSHEAKAPTGAVAQAGASRSSPYPEATAAPEKAVSLYSVPRGYMPCGRVFLSLLCSWEPVF